ncbi:MAG: hypothetical protein GY899_02055 [Verrucomicrobiaceae bacterium]|nr:hypothetical protein [Verrucomicrobiaceae bacterium]
MGTEEAARDGHSPIWKLWANPIVCRYARSRLRPRGLGVALLITLMIASFIFFFSRAVYEGQGTSRVDLARVPLVALLVLQGLILFVLATGQMAGGITAEADEGVIDYQRLAPMTPLAKVVGFLFGLPIREYVLFLVTLPFSLWSLWRGEVPFAIACQLYGVFMIAAVLYHLTGLVAGTVVKNRRWAFLLSMGVVFLLYTIVPQASKIGLVYFKYVTIGPVFKECLPYLVPRDVGAGVETLRNLMPPARFFDLDLPQAVFTVATQAILIIAMIVMLWRRWFRAESHLMGKVGAVGLFGWVQVMLLGNALPLVNEGDVFPSGIRRNWQFNDNVWSPHPDEVAVMSGAYGLVTLVILWAMIVMVTPNRDRQVRGWRRARKLGQERLAPGSDPATSFPWVGIMVFTGAAGWFWFTKEVVESHWFAGTLMPVGAAGAFFLVLATAGFGFHALLELKSPRVAGLYALLVGAAPLLVGIVLGATSENFASLAIWIVGVSPVVGPIYVTGSVLPLVDFDADFMSDLPRAFWFWQAVSALVALNLIGKLRRLRKGIAANSLCGDDRSSMAE